MRTSTYSPNEVLSKILLACNTYHDLTSMMHSVLLEVHKNTLKRYSALLCMNDEDHHGWHQYLPHRQFLSPIFPDTTLMFFSEGCPYSVELRALRGLLFLQRYALRNLPDFYYSLT